MSTVHHADAGVVSDSDDTLAEAPGSDALRLEPPAPDPRRYMMVSGTRAPVDDGLAAADFDYEQFAALAGPVTDPPLDEPYTVRYRRINHSMREWLTIRLIVVTLLALDFRFIYWLVFPSQYPDLSGWRWRGGIGGVQADAYILLLAGMAVGSIIMQLFL